MREILPRCSIRCSSCYPSISPQNENYIEWVKDKIHFKWRQNDRWHLIKKTQWSKAGSSWNNFDTIGLVRIPWTNRRIHELSPSKFPLTIFKYSFRRHLCMLPLSEKSCWLFSFTLEEQAFVGVIFSTWRRRSGWIPHLTLFLLFTTWSLVDWISRTDCIGYYRFRSTFTTRSRMDNIGTFFLDRSRNSRAGNACFFFDFSEVMRWAICSVIVF